MATVDKLGSNSALASIGKAIAWQVFNLGVAEGLSWKFKIGPFPVSIKLEKVRPVWEELFGPEPSA